jgi:hypothetical protein
MMLKSEIGLNEPEIMCLRLILSQSSEKADINKAAITNTPPTENEIATGLRSDLSVGKAVEDESGFKSDESRESVKSNSVTDHSPEKSIQVEEPYSLARGLWVHIVLYQLTHLHMNDGLMALVIHKIELALELTDTSQDETILNLIDCIDLAFENEIGTECESIQSSFVSWAAKHIKQLSEQQMIDKLFESSHIFTIQVLKEISSLLIPVEQNESASEQGRGSSFGSGSGTTLFHTATTTPKKKFKGYSYRR